MSRRLLVLALASACNAWAEPDEAHLGKGQGYPLAPNVVATQTNPYRIGSWSAMDKVPGYLVRQVARAAEPMALPAADPPLQVTYPHRNIGYTLQEYLERHRATGVLVLKDGRIVAEHYRYGRKEDARFLSFSMAKSVTSLLVGVAVQRGAIASLDDEAAKYVPALAGSAYGATTVRQLLRMSSGLTFSERYDGSDDVARMGRSFRGDADGTLPVLKAIADRHSPAGAKFVYASGETEVLGRILRGATGKTMAELTQEWLWQPMGAEHDAFWGIGRDGQEAAWSSFNASLRDWGRLGLLLARDGMAGTRQVLPREYLLDATDPARQPAAFKPRSATPYFGYGYQFWLLPMRERTFAMQGVYGQTVYVQPASGIVLVLTSAWEQASGRLDPVPYEERDALWRGVLRSLGGSID